jgi:hypothetical protein
MSAKTEELNLNDLEQVVAGSITRKIDVQSSPMLGCDGRDQNKPPSNEELYQQTLDLLKGAMGA